jgi:hypothetical protein
MKERYKIAFFFIDYNSYLLISSILCCYTSFMKIELLHWAIYDVTATESALNGVQLRGRTRKFAVEQGINMLIENTEDMSNAVRFAVLDEDDAQVIIDYIKSIASDAQIVLANGDVSNPVLSKITINNPNKY